MYNQTLYILQKEKREIIMVRKLKKIKKQLLGASKKQLKKSRTV